MTLSEQLDAHINEVETQTLTQPHITTTPTKVIPLVTVEPTTSNLTTGILDFKLNMLSVANERLAEGKNYLEIKELKDLNSIVKDLEASQNKDTSGPTVNILVQNMIDKYSDDI